MHSEQTEKVSTSSIVLHASSRSDLLWHDQQEQRQSEGQSSSIAAVMQLARRTCTCKRASASQAQAVCNLLLARLLLERCSHHQSAHTVWCTLSESTQFQYQCPPSNPSAEPDTRCLQRARGQRFSKREEAWGGGKAARGQHMHSQMAQDGLPMTCCA